MTTTKKEIVRLFMEKNFLVSEDMLEEISSIDEVHKIFETVKIAGAESLVYLNKDVKTHVTNPNVQATTPPTNINWQDLERTRVVFETTSDPELYEEFLRLLSTTTDVVASVQPARKDSNQRTLPSELAYQEESQKMVHIQSSNAPKGSVEVIVNHNDEAEKKSVQHFIAFFNNRYKALRSILQTRQELSNITSIRRLKNSGPRSSVAFIGIITEKAVTKNNNIILTIEDPTGTTKVLANNNKQDIFKIASECVLDEVVGIAGITGDGIVFANALLLPDIPLTKELKKAPDEVYAVFLSDVHVGSKKFLGEEFNKFLQWIRGEVGSAAQRDVAQKVKYIFVVGDLVDGVGIYPGQEQELSIPDIYDQYTEFARLIALIPKDKEIIIGPGNHDAVRLAEPQPMLDENFAKPLYELENVKLVSNPAYVKIHHSEEFPGFDVLMYHGYSFDHFVANIDSIRVAGGYDRIDLLMKFLLQRRHLAPTHTSSLYIPDLKKDPLVIDRVPDIFATGHIHKAVMANYRNITLISGSCWQAKTDFQEKVGHRPEPTRVPLLNLQTRQMKMMRFGDD